MQVKRVELALDEKTGMQMAAVGCLLMVAQFIADEMPDHTDVLRRLARAMIAEVPDEHLTDIVRFVADIVRNVIADEQLAANRAH